MMEWDPDEMERHATKVTTIKELYERSSKNIRKYHDNKS